MSEEIRMYQVAAQQALQRAKDKCERTDPRQTYDWQGRFIKAADEVLSHVQAIEAIAKQLLDVKVEMSTFAREFVRASDSTDDAVANCQMVVDKCQQAVQMLNSTGTDAEAYIVAKTTRAHAALTETQTAQRAAHELGSQAETARAAFQEFSIPSTYKLEAVVDEFKALTRPRIFNTLEELGNNAGLVVQLASRAHTAVGEV